MAEYELTADEVTDDGPGGMTIAGAVVVTAIVAALLFGMFGVAYSTGYAMGRERAAHLAGAMGHPEVAKAIQELP